ncbi:MAG TPA: LysR family transcriptional regulator [Geminicoccaceae bacterium]|nr:LysR family transcriptional regulator [Geminicoccus sp.]HMU49540.1 LysR family transcriptional regulator [Geminicoccaceae bacterium]
MPLDRNLLPAVAAFAEVAREGSFTRAAGRLGVSPSALSQTVRGLEGRLGVRLLNRSTRSVSRTEDGRRLLAQADPGLAMIAHALGTLGDAREKPSGELRVNVSRIAARHFVEPHLGEFARRHPLVRLELVIDDGLGDIVREGCDAGIRLRESLAESMIAVPITPPVAMAVVGSPAYFAAHPPPRTLDDLARHNCLAYRHSGSAALYRWDFTDTTTGQDHAIEPHGSFVTNSDDVMLTAALQGVGLVMHMDFVVRQHIASGALVRVLQSWCPPFAGFHLYLPTRDQMPAKLRALVDFLVEKRGV